MFKFSEEFVQQLIKKNKSYFNSFYLDTVDVFFSYLKGNYFLSENEIEDIISDFYVKFWNGIGNYNSEYKFENWVWVVFKNNLKDYFKKKKDASFSDLTNNENGFDFEENLLSNDDIKEFLDKNFELEYIKDAIDKLDEDSKEIMFLKYTKELSNDEISNITGFSNDNIRKRVSRAIKKIRNFLE